MPLRKEANSSQFIEGLFLHTINYIENEDFRLKSKETSSAFSRKRKFSFKDLVINILGFSRASVRTELDRFFKSLSRENSKITTFTKSAFTQARQKLKPDSFVELHRSLLDHFGKHAPSQKSWKGKRVVAIDGSFLILPNEKCLMDKFGTFSNQKKAVSTGARISLAYDVCNGLVLDALIGHTQTDDEKEMAKSHLSALNSKTDVLVFDRGYPSLWLIAYLKKEGFDFCFRLSTTWKTAYQTLESSEKKDIDFTLRKRPSQEYGKLKTYGLPSEVAGLRLTSVDLANGEKEVLLTSLADKEIYPMEALKELYHMRWGIEECYKRIKQIAQMEYFSGRTVHAVQQDFYARIILLNIAAMIGGQAEVPKRESKACKYAVQINRTQVITKVKDFLIDIFYLKEVKTSVLKIFKLLENCIDIIRPNRQFKRNKAYKEKRKPLMYKGM
jgi:hypothetical protein